MKKVLLISGVTGGVGQAVAQLFSKTGYEVVGLSRSVCDITDEQMVQNAVINTIKQFGRIDVCVHSAVDQIARVPLHGLDLKAFRGQFEAALFGGFTLIKAASEQMKTQHSGVIVGITSDVLNPGPSVARLGAYTTAKAALRRLLKEFSAELRGTDIRVLAVAPGLMKTRLTADLPNKYFEFVEHASEKKLMTPEEVAQAVLYLCEGGGSNHTDISYDVATGTTSEL